MAEPTPTSPEMVVARRFQALEARVSKIERPTGSQNNRNKDKVQAALEALQQAVADLQDQNAYLASLTTRVVRAEDDLFNTTPGSQIIDPSTAPSLTFELDEPMRVRMQVRAQALLNASGPGGSSIEAYAIARMYLDGTLIAADEASSRARTALLPPSGANYNTGGDSILLAENIATLTAGSHTVASQWRSQGIGASCSIFIENRTLTVEILGRP